MSRIDQIVDKINWNQTGQSSKAHPDYERNLREAQEICKREDTGHRLLNGLRVKIADSEHLQKALMIISWCPGITVKKGKCATPIFLHQYNEDFKKTAANVINFYKNTIQNFESKKQPELFPVEKKA